MSMGLRIFSVVGEALNFGFRRMETIARVAWLPVILLMIVNMVTVFAYLSVIAERLITFTDLSNYTVAQQTFMRLAATGFSKSPQEMWLITGVNLTLSWILISSYMAPLIRYAGLGEKPAPGAVRAPFGADQLRYIGSSILSFLFVAVLVFGPIAGATYYVMKYIADALSQTIATFPDPSSLHTIEVTTLAQQLAGQGSSFIYDNAIPLAGVAPLAALLWVIIFLHFHPRNRPAAGDGGNMILRAIVTLGLTAGLLGVGYFLLAEVMLNTFKSSAGFLGSAANLASQLQVDASAVLESLGFLLKSPVARLLFFATVSFYLVNYFGLRLFAYPGVAVCRKSVALGQTLKVTRGWNIIRLWVIVTFLSAMLGFVQVFIINGLFLTVFLPWIVTLLYEATATSTKLVNSGAVGDWVLPTFVWIWNITKMAINVVWGFFSFGVAAGLYGRLYRESEAGA